MQNIEKPLKFDFQKSFLIRTPLNQDKTINVDILKYSFSHDKPLILTDCQINRQLWNPDWFHNYVSKPGNDKFNSKEYVCCLSAAFNPENPINLARYHFTLSDFWAGFDNPEVRKNLSSRSLTSELREFISSKDGNFYPCLKLKDWPNTNDLQHLFSDHFEACFESIPVSEYVTREGEFNLPKYLPNYFIPPELGPKLYSAYSMIDYCDFVEDEKMCANVPTASTVSHTDLSDAVNLLCYTGKKTITEHNLWKIKAVCKHLYVPDFEIEKFCTLENKDQLGAIWHIFDPNKTNEIRAVLAEVDAEDRQRQLELESLSSVSFTSERLRNKAEKARNSNSNSMPPTPAMSESNENGEYHSEDENSADEIELDQSNSSKRSRGRPSTKLPVNSPAVSSTSKKSKKLTSKVKDSETESNFSNDPSYFEESNLDENFEEEELDETEGQNDMIHDQTTFINRKVLEKCKKRNIEFSAFIQNEGDAVYIPSGAVHQVSRFFLSFNLWQIFLTFWYTFK